MDSPVRILSTPGIAPSIEVYANTIEYADGSEATLFQTFSALSVDEHQPPADPLPWNLYYHLSPLRKALLNWMALGIEPLRILELGAGCGAITSFLVHLPRSSVTAIEGSLQRAKVIQQRCKNARNLSIQARDIEGVHARRKCDIVTLIGVLEYAGRYGRDIDPYKDLLERVYDLVADDGTLILAIENQFGHKYLAGYPEDHGCGPYEGVNGYPNECGIRTFDDQTLRDMLTCAGFDSQSWYFPFPDYKLPQVIFSDAGLNHDIFNPLPLMNLPTQDFATHAQPAFDESRLIRKLWGLGTLRSFMNSFLILASKGAASRLQQEHQDLLAVKLNLDGRGTPFQTRTTFVENGSGQVRVERRRLHSDSARRFRNGSHHLPEEREPYFANCSCLADTILEKILSSDLEAAAACFAIWEGELNRYSFQPSQSQRQAFADFSVCHLGQTIYEQATGSDRWIWGEFIDLHPGNLLIAVDDSSPRLIDKEWSLELAIPLQLVFDRGLMVLSNKLRRRTVFARRQVEKHTYLPEKLVSILRHSPLIPDRDLPSWYAFESWFNAAVKKGNLDLRTGSVVESIQKTTVETEAFAAQPTQITCSDIVSIIILTHNQLELTKACLSSIENALHHPHEIIIVDNGSDDGSVNYLRAYVASHPHLTLVQNASNQGFAAGNNQGLALARGRDVLLLNNDTLLTDGCIERMLDALASNPQAGIVGPMSNYVSGPQLVQDTAYTNEEELATFAREWAREHAGQRLPSPRVVGFCMLIRREVIEHIGGLDERFGSGNFEDDDYCLRARIAGYEATIARDAFVHHIGSQTFKSAGIDYRRSMLRNWELFKSKWGIPAHTPIEAGYRLELSREEIEPAQLQIPLPALTRTHSPSGEGRIWEEQGVPAGRPIIALLGGDEEIHPLFWKQLEESCSRPLSLVIAGSLVDESQLPDGWTISYTESTWPVALNTLTAGEFVGEGADEVDDAWFLVLSRDIVPTPGCMDRLLSLLGQDDRIAAAGPLANRAPRPQAHRAKYRGTDRALRRFAESRAKSHGGKHRETAYLGGFCLAVRGDVVTEVGGLREGVDVAVALWEWYGRLRAANYQTAVALDAYVHHAKLTRDEGRSFDDWFAAEKQAEKALAKGNDALEQEQLEAAARAFAEAAEQAPHLAAGHAALGSVLLASGDTEGALPALRQAAQLAPWDAAIENQLGVALYRSGDVAGARNAFLQAHKAGDIEALLNVTELYRDQGQYDQATEAIKHALEMDASHPEVLATFGTLSFELGEVEGAQMAFQRLREIAPEHPITLILEQALEEYVRAEEAVTRYPTAGIHAQL